MSSNIDTEKLVEKLSSLGFSEKNIIYQINAFSVMSLRSVTAKTSWIINALVGNTGPEEARTSAKKGED